MTLYRATMARRYERFRKSRKCKWAEETWKKLKVDEEKRLAEKRKQSKMAQMDPPVEKVDVRIQTVTQPGGDCPKFWYYRKVLPVHIDAIDLIPANECFKLGTHGDRIILSKKNLGPETNDWTSRAHHNKRLTQYAILRRISKSFRRANGYNQRQANKRRANMPRSKRQEFTTHTTHNKITGYFLNEYMVKGEQALPMIYSETDPSGTDDEYYKAVLEKANNKPSDYEEHMPPYARITSMHRKVRQKIAEPLIRPNKRPNQSSDENPGPSKKRFKEKDLDDLPCTESTPEGKKVKRKTKIQFHNETTDETESPMTDMSDVTSIQGSTASSSESIETKPCSVILPKIDLKEGEHALVKIDWPTETSNIIESTRL